jgi:hypothetical protein
LTTKIRKPLAEIIPSAIIPAPVTSPSPSALPSLSPAASRRPDGACAFWQGSNKAGRFGDRMAIALVKA